MDWEVIWTEPAIADLEEIVRIGVGDTLRISNASMSLQQNHPLLRGILGTISI